MRAVRRLALLLIGVISVSWVLLPGGVARSQEGAPKDILENGKKRYSQYDEELVIRHFFDDRRGGFFVDVGSWHWTLKSTTFYLEKHLGWSGIAIDAQADLAPGYRRYRPRTRFFNHIVTDHSGTVETIYAAGELTSTKADHIDLFPGAEQRVDELLGGLQAVEVPTITLNELLDRNGVESIDFLSMDIEQGEPAALAGFDIARFRPALVCIEASPQIRAQITSYFNEHGYERIDAYLAYDSVNWYYRPKADRSDLADR